MSQKHEINKFFTDTKILSKLFFFRFFRNELMPFENESEFNFIVVLSIISALGLFFTFNLLFKYVFVPENGNSWLEKSYIILIFMLMVGFITLIEWDVLFPDKIDYSVLGTLPIEARTIFISKFISFLLFVTLFAFSANVFSAFFFPVFLGVYYNSSSPLFFIRFFLVHLVSALFAGMLIFFSLLILRGVFTIIFPLKFYKKISSSVKGILLVFILTIFAYIPQINKMLNETMHSGDKSKLFYFPNMWFTGLYEYLLGRNFIFYKRLSTIAIYSLLLTFFLSVGVFLISYLKYSKTGFSCSEGGEIKNRFKVKLKEIFNSIFLKNPTEKAIYYFLKKSLNRSSKQKLKVYAYSAVGIGIIISKYITEHSYLNHHKKFFEWHSVVFSAPFIFFLFLLIGLRSASNIPINPESNWIFKLTENKNKKFYIRAIHKSIFFQNIIPLMIFFSLFYSFIWNFKKSMLFTLYILFIIFIVEQLIFLNIKFIPYTRISLPGKSTHKLLLVPYFLLFLIYISSTSYFGYWLCVYPELYYKNFLFLSIPFTLIFLLMKKFFEKENFNLVFEEEPEPVMLNFHPVKY